MAWPGQIRSAGTKVRTPQSQLTARETRLQIDPPNTRHMHTFCMGCWMESNFIMVVFYRSLECIHGSSAVPGDQILKKTSKPNRLGRSTLLL